MVWFQCEDCGENLKKPKLPNHFRICYSNKFSCIDCGVTFGQQSVQGHNQCITEAEKYGPKGQGKASNGTSPKVKGDTKQKPDIDINVGLSERPPWFCSLCNTKATSQQALLLHAEGKKHRAKARAFHAANQQSKQMEESTPNTNISTENGHKGGLPDNKDERESQELNSPKVVLVKNSSEAENGIVSSNKKRKIDTSEEDGARKKAGHITSGEVVNGDVIQMDRAAGEEKKVQGQEADHNTPKENKVVEASSAKENTKKKIKWKKMITSALKSNPDGVLKMRKLRKLVLKSIQESGSTEDEDQLRDMLEQKINSSSRFEVDNKYVHLVAQN